jgi:hypothetical protein
VRAHTAQIGVDQEPRDGGRMVGIDSRLPETLADKGQDTILAHEDEFFRGFVQGLPNVR